MPGPTPKPRDQRARRNRNEGTESTTVDLPPEAPAPPAWAGPTTRIELAPGWAVEVPKPPTGLLKASREAWAMFWVIPEAIMLRPHHMPALRRLVQLYDEEERIRRRVARQRPVPMPAAVGLDGIAQLGELVLETETRMVQLPGHLGIGSQGQIVESPDFKALQKVRERIQALEDRFAATPLAQYRVGWQRAAMANAEARAAEATELARAAAAIAAQHEALLLEGGDG